MQRTAQALQKIGYEISIIDKRKQIGIDSQSKVSVDHVMCWFTKGILFYLEFNTRLLCKLLQMSTDILLSVDSDTLLANTIVSKIKGTPLILDMHELFTEVPELVGYPVKKNIWKWVEKLGITQSSKRYTVSKTIAEQYELRYGKSFEVIRNVPMKNLREGDKQKAANFTLVYLGAINLGRGLKELIHALKQIEDIELMIYGSGDLDVEIRKLIDQLSLSNRVHFIGWIDPKYIPEVLANAHVGVNFLDPKSQSYYLSLANKYFDYIHAGLPIISMNFPEYRLLNQEHKTSLLIDDLSEPTIVDAILKIKNNSAVYSELVDNCKMAKDAWNWQSESKRLTSIFDL